ncbi:MAG: class IV adenylate cyclase [Patescibacteria group bacterium]|jgi:adenylate cyclase class IV
MKNIELKLKLNDFARVKRSARAAGVKEISVLYQTDTYFNVASGRLKLREINGKVFELINYFRSDKKSSKLSSYEIFNLNKDQAMLFKKALSRILGIRVTVKKKRNLWLHEHTRIHFDQVSGLGKYLELETVLWQSNSAAQKEHKKVIKMLGLDKYKKIAVSYNDLLLGKK